MFLQNDEFRTIVACAPLVSIDLVVENRQGELLLGLRKGEPAKGYWFVPGGRVRKSERLDDAFSRIAHDELGRDIARESAELLGIFEHHYDASAVGEDISTHYVVLAYRIVQADFWPQLEEQHSRWRWFYFSEAAEEKYVHPYVKDYLDTLGSVGRSENGQT